jgi:hypothetical protein
MPVLVDNHEAADANFGTMSKTYSKLR